MKRIIILAFLLLAIPAYAQQGVVIGPISPCSAFGTASGTCLQGAGALGAPASGNGSNITNVNAATLGGATFAAPGPIGGGTPSTIAATSNTSPLIIGGTGAASTLSLESTSGVGTTDAIIGLTGSQVERFRVTTGGLFNIGPAVAPDALLTMNGNTGTTVAIVSGTFAHIIAADGAFGGIYIDVYGNQSFIIPRRANGTQASKTALIANDVAFAFGPNGWDGSIYTNVGALNFIAAENYDGTHHGNAITFRTVPLASTAVAEAGRWNPSGGLSIGTTTDPGIGGLQVNGQQFNPNMASDSGIADSTVCTATTGGKLLKGSGTLGICLGTSGAQFKTAFAPMAAGIDDLMKIDFQNYRYREGFGDSGERMQYGPTAQNVEGAIPDLVRHNASGAAINYDSGALLFVGLRSIQQVNTNLEQLKADNDNLRACQASWTCRIFGVAVR